MEENRDDLPEITEEQGYNLLKMMFCSDEEFEQMMKSEE